MLNRTSSVRRSAVVEAGGGGRRLLLKCLLSAVAVLPGSEAPGCSISNAALGQRHFVFVSHGRRDRLLMRLRSLRSDLTLRLLSPISTFTMRGKEQWLVLVSVALICGSDRFLIYLLVVFLKMYEGTNSVCASSFLSEF